jgi:DNA-binding NtrC family response regulator
MDPKKIITGKKILIVDDEQDILQTLTELLQICKLDRASNFEQAKDLLKKNNYDVAILDIMGVEGFKLLRIAKDRGIPALMLTAHALTEQNLKRAAEEGASYYAPKEEISRIETFVADVIEAKEEKRNPWVRWFESLGDFYDKKFTGPNWREKESEFWKKKLRSSLQIDSDV